MFSERTLWYIIISGIVFLCYCGFLIATAPDRCKQCPFDCKHCPYDKNKNFAKIKYKVMISKTQKAKRKYNLTFMLRKKGFRLSTPSKTIYAAHDKLADFPLQLTSLISEYNYVVQTEIQ